ncbi:hypothetical protein CDV50_15325 [Haematobacter massiliensis]|uniref:Uncharacterized protein n=1 Tax=Haematobacter massiliensis TaxID=195105 RepID=A0A086Y144_9RHOB|nr:hypothetical protein [Haematobacter massiliensis]KFI27994.1 hypothetical protein CN97_20220 [Haematobacter massiliensis]OWJ70031.1 hypothetical protein CDV50_15325 [Haematobacter massiliensis]OWJ83348.1 hypothetical protein CDV51_16120 [Haematobacter massiliensis]QBJ23129.1 hypothetical protein HmaOT1_01885 [Haematobacter massiliensis]
MVEKPLDDAAARMEEELARILSDISAELRLHDVPERLRILARELDAALAGRREGAAPAPTTPETDPTDR